MGLSGDTDPTKGLPPVDVSGDDMVEVDKMGGTTGVADVPPGFAIEQIDAATLLSKEMIDTNHQLGDKFSGKRKAFEDGDQQVKRPKVSDEAEGSVVGERRSRPKKLVAARNLGLMNRREIRQAQQVVHSSSSADEYEVNPDTGEKRQRVGFLFKTAPRPVLPDFLTADDQWKLDGCTISKRLKRVERVAGQV